MGRASAHVAVALASRRGSAQDVLVQFEQVLGEWDELGDDAAQWWLMLQVARLLETSGYDRLAALLIGDFRENGQPTFLLLGDQDRCQTAVAMLATGWESRRPPPPWRRGRSSPSTTPPPRRRRPGPRGAAVRAASSDGHRVGRAVDRC
jgi:hypothetical protein